MTTTPVIQNTMIKLADLAPHPSNYRTHPESQIQDLMASLLRFGQVKSIVIQEGPHPLCVAGHGIVEAARRLDYSALRADVIPADWSPADVKGYLIADNQHAANALDDEAQLSALLQEQREAGFDLSSLGSSEDELQAILDRLEEEGEDGYTEGAGGDDYAKTPDEVEHRCKRGDLWQLGTHRLLVDDSTKRENVTRLMQGEKAVLMATDPPYGDSWIQKAKDMQAHGYGHSRAGLHGSIASDDLSEVALKAFLLTFLEAAKAAGDAPMPFYVWHRAKRIVFEQSLIESGYFVHQPVVWVKPGFVIGRLHYHPRCEWALHGWRTGNGVCPFYGERNQSDVWEVDRENDKIHPTQKPLELFTIPLRNHTRRGEICYEPFAGSGTQIIAAEREARRCYAMEIDEGYASVILDRWEAETGGTASLLTRLEVSV